jgi:hypothetical protein
MFSQWHRSGLIGYCARPEQYYRRTATLFQPLHPGMDIAPADDYADWVNHSSVTGNSCAVSTIREIDFSNR